MIIDLCKTSYFDDIEKVKAFKGQGGTACVITFGCQQNEADSEKIKTMLSEMGYALRDDYSGCDLIILNTCAIRAHAEKKVYSLLGYFKAEKKKNPDLLVGVVGCMAAEEEAVATLKGDFHFVNFTLEPNMLHRLPSLILKSLCDNKRSFIIGEDRGDIVEGIEPYRRQGHRAYVSIMYGCNNFCSYCIVPYVRGRERSRRSEDIISECRALVASGVKEITLLGQNVNSYRSDLDFPGLLERIAGIEGDFIIRFMTSHPKDVSDGLISVMAKYNPKIAPYFHLPLQSGSDKVLKDMRRTYDSKKFINTVRLLRESIPDIALSTDVIVGFPTEEEEDFRDTLGVLRECEFDMVYSFIFSKREGTAAANLVPRNTEEQRRARMDELLHMQDSISYSKNQPYLGKTLRVLVDSPAKRSDGSTYSARTDTNKLVHFNSARNRIGSFINVKITKANAFDLMAEEIERETKND